MSTAPESTPQATPPPAATAPSALDRLAPYRQPLGYALLLFGIAFLVLAVWSGTKAYKATALATPQAPLGMTGAPADLVVLTFASGFLGVLFLFTGTYLVTAKPEPGEETSVIRRALLIDGSVAGWATILLAAALAYAWADTVFGGWTKWRGPQAWRLWTVIFTAFGGMVLAFASLQLARAEERTSQFWRKALYGSNAAFSCMMLLGILALVNLLVYVPWGPLAYAGKEYAWSTEGTYALASKSENVLKGLTAEKPAHIYVIIPTGDQFYFALVALMDNMKATVNDDERFQVEFLSPDRDRDRVERLRDEYKFDDRSGILILYGSGKARDSRFVKYTDLFDVRVAQGGSLFKGEQAVMTELSLLQEGKSRPTIYFTQGNGELDLNDGVRDPNRLNEGAGILKRQLELIHYKVKGLQLAEIPTESRDPNIVVETKIPDDCGVLVIAGPRFPWPHFAIKALDDYLVKRQGRALIYFDKVLSIDRKLVNTGLEKYLEKFNVVVGEDRVLRFVDRGDPEMVQARVPAARGPNEQSFAAQLAGLFRNVPIPLSEVRTVRPTERPLGDARFVPETFLIVDAPNAFVDTNVGMNAMRVIAGWDPAELGKKMATDRQKGPISIAVSVSELPPGDPHEMRQMEGKPRLAVYGDATLLSNGYLSRSGADELSMALFLNMLAWLRERPTEFGIQPHKSDVFMLRRPPGFETVVLPGLLVFVSIISLGAGVWVVRRR
jgi:hypothetical protein